MVTLNESHTMILVCAADDFRKYRKIEKLRFVLINHKKSVISKKIKCLVFFKIAGRVCNHLNFNSVETALKTINFLKSGFLHF